MIIMCQCWFVHCNKCTTLVGGVDGEVDCGKGGRGMWELSVLYTHFCYESTAALKNEVF